MAVAKPDESPLGTRRPALYRSTDELAHPRVHGRAAGSTGHASQVVDQ
jgi:hypothetical protein